MNALPRYRAVFGADVVGSGRLPGHYHNALHRTLNEAVSSGLAQHGISKADLVDHEDLGDGLLMTLPSEFAGALLDATQTIDSLLAEHNTHHKPEVRLRMAIEIGPVADTPGLAATKVDLSRMLNADSFCELFQRVLAERPPDTVNSALVVSEQVRRAVLDGGHATAVRSADFAPIHIINKEFDRHAWVRVPGCDLRGLVQPTSAGEHAQSRMPSVTNNANGAMSGVQAGVINGSLTFGGGR